MKNKVFKLKLYSYIDNDEYTTPIPEECIQYNTKMSLDILKELDEPNRNILIRLSIQKMCDNTMDEVRKMYPVNED